MRRAHLEHAIRAACQITGQREVIVIGSGAIFAHYDETALPEEATRSVEIDILPIGADAVETERLADRIDGAAGEFSLFHSTHGFYLDGVTWETAILPSGWHARLVAVSNDNTAAPGGRPRFVGRCLDKEDLCVAKLCAGRTKDTRFVGALIAGCLVDARTIAGRLRDVPEHHTAHAHAAWRWLSVRYRVDA